MQNIHKIQFSILRISIKCRLHLVPILYVNEEGKFFNVRYWVLLLLFLFFVKKKYIYLYYKNILFVIFLIFLAMDNII